MRNTRLRLTTCCILLTSAAGCGGDSVGSPGTGTLEIRATTSGVEPDGDGYIVQVDAGQPQPLVTGAAIEVPDVEPGSHAVLLGEIAPNCTVEGDNPRTVSLAAGQTATLEFAVACAATTGGAEITVSTTGPSPDPDGYGLSVDGADQGSIAPSTSLTLDQLSPGSHSVGLAGLAANCQIEGDNPRVFTVTPGTNVGVVLSVTCNPPPPSAGTLQVQTTTSGVDPDPNGYAFFVDGGSRQPIGVSATASLPNLAAGSHAVRLSGLAPNCDVQGQNPRPVTLEAGATANVSFAIICAATTGTIRVQVATSGAPTDPDGYTVTLDGGSSRPVGTTGTTTFTTPSGNHTVELAGLASNCSVAAGRANEVRVDVGSAQDVNFAVTCTAVTGTVNVTVTSSGAPPDPDGYQVELDIRGVRKPVAVNGTTTFSNVAAGDHIITLIAVALNCTVPGGAEQIVSVTGGGTADVAFAVVCSGTETSWNTIPFNTEEFNGLAIWSSSPSNIIVSGSYPNAIDNTILHYNGSAWVAAFNGGRSSYGSLSGLSPTEVYAAVGDGEVLRWNGSLWQDVGPARERANFMSVWAAAPQNIFVGGWEDATPENGLIEHFDGSAWSPQQSHGFGTYGEVYDMSGVSSGEVFALGRESPYDVTPEEDYLLSGVSRYDGAGWSRSYDTREDFLNAIWANAGNDVYVVTRAGGILHFDGAAWTPMTSPTTQPLTDVWGNSSSNVYAVGAAGILHFDGTAWTVLNSTPALRVWGTATEVYALTRTAVLYRAH